VLVLLAGLAALAALDVAGIALAGD